MLFLCLKIRNKSSCVEVITWHRTRHKPSPWPTLPWGHITSLGHIEFPMMTSVQMDRRNKLLWFLYARLKNGRIMLWQCPSVCPSVRPESAKKSNIPWIWRIIYGHKLPYMKKTKITLYEEDKKEEASMRCSLLHGSWDQILRRRPSVRVFRTFFQHALRYQIETWYMHLVGDTTCRVWVSSQLGHFDLVYSQM